MPSLTHVCMWDNKRWIPVTAEQAAKLHPGGTVSANSGLFMCDLCGQYVLLTDGEINVRHFKHSKAETSKDCPERTFGPNVSIAYSSNAHELPIRIKDITFYNFSLELGFISIPPELKTANLQIHISSADNRPVQFTYNSERLRDTGITYLSLGDIPKEKYQIRVSNSSNSIYDYWPKTVLGISPDGVLFDIRTGRMLPYDSDVEVGRAYYLLRRGRMYRTCQSVHVVETCKKRIQQTDWYIYKVIAQDYNKESARFFLDYHCRLSDQPVNMQVVWPLYAQDPFKIRHLKTHTVFYVSGNVMQQHTFPEAATREYKLKSAGKVLDIYSNGRQQLISVGRSKVLQYEYYWKEPIGISRIQEQGQIYDLHGNTIASGDYETLPYRNSININLPYDGYAKIIKDRVISGIQRIKAGISVDIDCIDYGTEIYVYVGSDLIWSAKFVDKDVEHNNEQIVDNTLLTRISSYNGDLIPVPHALRNMTYLLRDDTELRQWLITQIKNGLISKRAFRDLQRHVSNMTDNNTVKGGHSI